jgi:MSHA biogenesis protein MshM
VAARSGEGFIKITGEVGTGKTLLCRKFMASLGPDFVTAYIPNPYLEPRTLMLALADELELPLQRDVDQHQLLKSITLRLMELAREGKQVLLCWMKRRRFRRKPGSAAPADQSGRKSASCCRSCCSASLS